jgi:hypothetical protein
MDRRTLLAGLVGLPLVAKGALKIAPRDAAPYAIASGEAVPLERFASGGIVSMPPSMVMGESCSEAVFGPFTDELLRLVRVTYGATPTPGQEHVVELTYTPPEEA